MAYQRLRSSRPLDYGRGLFESTKDKLNAEETRTRNPGSTGADRQNGGRQFHSEPTTSKKETSVPSSRRIDAAELTDILPRHKPSWNCSSPFVPIYIEKPGDQYVNWSG
jgi:hypothetical protein